MTDVTELAPTDIKEDAKSHRVISDYYSFSVNEKNYVYDCNTNGILELPKKLFDSFPSWINEPEALSDSNIRKYDSAVENGLLGKSRPIIKNPLDNISINSLKNISSITLCVTESCNLRCSYCTYGDRWNSSKQMSFETVQKALNLIDHENSKEIVIGFYGGEPLLSFSLIKKTIAYARDKFADTELLFNMTSNGTLINQDIASFLIEEKIHLLISLDGPQDIHDKSRKTAKGEGSYNKIMESLALLKELSPKYYSEFIRFNMVIAPPIDIESINSFLINDLPLPPNRCTVSLAEQPNSQSSVTIEYSEKDFEQLTKLRSEAELNFINEDMDRDPFASLFYSKTFRKIAFRSRNDISDKPFVPAGQCIPGTQKIYVDINGGLHICERVGDSNPIGNVNSKIDMEKINTSLNKFYGYSQTNCANCFAKRLCGICLASAIESDCFDATKLKSECKVAREFLKRNLQSYVRILDKNPQAFDTALGFIRQKSFT